MTKKIYNKLLIHHLFEKQVLKNPDNIAIEFEDNQLTYRELNIRANKLANYLGKKGIVANDTVGLYLEESLNSIIGLMGILKAGCSYIPIDPTHPIDRISSLLQDAQVSGVITMENLHNSISSSFPIICLDTEECIISQMSVKGPNITSNYNNLAYIIYTSGSTGNPKGVMVTHKNLINYTMGIIERINFCTAESFALVSTISADLGNTMIFPCLSTGGTLHILSKETSRNPYKFIEYIHKKKINNIKITPTHYNILTNDSIAELPVKRIIFGGEKLKWDIVETVRRLSPQAEIYNHYGPTETTVGVLLYKVDESNYNLKIDTVPIGRPLKNTQVYLLDSDGLEVPIGVLGEIYIGGENVSKGYLNESELTKKKFIPNPIHKTQNEIVYRTGDMGKYLPSGEIEFIGREDSQVNINGYRVELEEVNSVLKGIPGVHDSVVLVNNINEDNSLLLAFVVMKDKDNRDLRLLINKKLPLFMVPKIVQVESIPLTSNGKIDTHFLLNKYNTRIKNKDNSYHEKYENQLELSLIEYWSIALQTRKIDVEKNLFELGLDSIQVIKFITWVRKKLNVNLNVKTIFERNNIRDISKSIKEKLSEVSEKKK